MNKVKLISTSLIAGFLLLFSLDIITDFNETKIIIQQNKNTKQEIKEINKEIEEITKLEKDERVIEIKKVNAEVSEEINKLAEENELINKDIKEVINERLDIYGTEWEAEITDLDMCFHTCPSYQTITGKLTMMINDTGVIIKVLPEDDDREITISGEIVAVDEELGVYTINSLKDNEFTRRDFWDNTNMNFTIAVKDDILTCLLTFNYSWSSYGYNKAFILNRL